jgi:hypothetical protein
LVSEVHDIEDLLDQLHMLKLQDQRLRTANKKLTVRCSALEVELRKTDRKLEVAVAGRGGDANLNNAQMRSEVRRLRAHVHDLQASNQQKEALVRELEQSTRNTRLKELEIACEE